MSEQNKTNGSMKESTTTVSGRRAQKANREKLYRYVLLAMLAALVVVLQFWGSGIKIGITSLSLVLIPIVVGSLTLGVGGGAVLGALFGVITLICGITGMDPFTQYLFQSSPFITVLICLVKGSAAGAVPALVHRALSRRFPRSSVILASAAAPIANTGLFMLGCCFLLKPLEALVGDVVYFLFFTILVCNFLVEFAVNLIAGPAIYQILQISRRRTRH